MEKAKEVINQTFVATTRELGLRGMGLRLHTVIDKKFSAGGTFHVDHIGPVVTVYLNNVRTKRDAIFIVAHEVRHAYQYEKMGVFRFNLYGLRSSIAISTGNFLGYFFSEVEYDANKWALEYEGKLDYNNEVWNNSVPSSFLDTKKHLDRRQFDNHIDNAEFRTKELYAL